MSSTIYLRISHMTRNWGLLSDNYTLPVVEPWRCGLDALGCSQMSCTPDESAGGSRRGLERNIQYKTNMKKILHFWRWEGTILVPPH